MKPVVLIVDDDSAVRNSLKFSLELDGFSVRTFASAMALLESADVSQSHCIIIDYKLPEMDGLQLLEQLRKRRVSVPAILITSQPSRRLRDLATRAGVPIVEKPLLSNALSEGIREAVASRMSRRA